MKTRRGATGLSGILVIDKPQGMTSHDVVNRVRFITGERRVGHAGTLDPMATGLLVVLVGPATRLASYLTAAEKTYTARILFGAQTDTDDADGRIVRTAPVPDEVCDPFAASSMVAALVGSHDQVPPAYSAVKQGGVTAYSAARKGESLTLEARVVTVAAATLLGVEIDPPSWDVELSVSKGTYIRALARDLGRACESAAYLGGLRRTRSGSIALSQAHTLDEIEAAPDVTGLFADPVGALGLPVLDANREQAADVKDGRAFPVKADVVRDGELFAISQGGALIAIYKRDGERAKPAVVIPGGVAGVLQ